MAAPKDHDAVKWVSMIVDLVYRPLCLVSTLVSRPYHAGIT
jgi:hypothetical protein